MEEDKAAAYYDELTRKGEGAARFKQGLGFSSSSSNPKTANSSKLSPFTSFVPASNPRDAEKRAQLETIHSKLNKNPSSGSDDLRSRRRPSSSSSGGLGVGRDRSSRSSRDGRDRESSHRRSRSRSRSPYREARDKGSPQRRGSKNKRPSVDYSALIEGYSQMTPVERVKAKMKVQLSQTAAKDTTMGMNTGWERFDFNKDAPLDDEDEIEVAEDDAALVKVIGKSFRFSAAEAKREEEMKTAHDQAMFGAPAASPIFVETGGSNEENDATDDNEKKLANNLVSDKVLAMQQGSWRDRARKFHSSSGN